MRLATPCPACGKGVPFTRLLAAFLPTAIRCPACGARLAVKRRWITITFVCAVACAVATVAAYRQFVPREERSLVKLLLLATAAGLLFELAWCALVCLMGRLELRERASVDA